MKDNFDYLGELVRLCQSFDDFCKGCPLSKGSVLCGGSPCNIIENDNLEHVKSLIKEWSDEHPVKTRSTEFKKIYPNCKVDNEGYPTICPYEFNTSFLGPCNSGSVTIDECVECRRKYWGTEV